MPRIKPGQPRMHPVAEPRPVPDCLEPKPVVGQTAKPRTIFDTKRKKFICGVWRPRAGLHCMSAVLFDCGRCRVHGGNSLRGSQNGNYKDGRRSKYTLPPRLQERYEECLEDPELISLRDEIALSDIRIQSLIDKLNASATLTMWTQFKEAFETLTEKAKAGDLAAVLEQLDRVKSIDTTQHYDEDIWEDIQAAIDSKTRVAAAEWKRLADTDRLITVEQVIDIMTTLMHTVMDIVTDEGQRRKIRDAIRGYLENKDGRSGRRHSPFPIDPVVGISAEQTDSEEPTIIEIPPPPSQPPATVVP